MRAGEIATALAVLRQLIAYSMVTKALIRDSERLGLSSRDLDKLAVNTDGTIDWFSIIRFYGPEKTLFDKTFVLPDFEKVD